MSHFRIILLITLTPIVSTGCDSTLGANEDEAQRRNTISVFLTQYKAIHDCDAGPGDFEFETIVKNNGVEVDGDARDAELNDGETAAINKSIVFDAEQQDGNAFTVTFNAKERDDPLIGPPNYNDLNRDATMTHTFGSGGWSNVPATAGTPITIEVSKASSCKVELSYTVALK